jgi:hypothetical protein
VEPEEVVVENNIPQPKETQITRVEPMNVSAFQTYLFYFYYNYYSFMFHYIHNRPRPTVQ